jgi:hypothetical protein
MLLLTLLACKQPITDTARPEPADSGDTLPDDTAPGDTSVAAVSNIEARIDADFGTLVHVSWQQDQSAEAWVEYSFEADSWLSSPAVSVGEGAAEALLLGIPYDEEVTLRVVNDFGAGPRLSESITITTDPLPDGLPVPEVTLSDPTAYDDAMPFLLMSITEYSGGFAAIYSDWWVFIMDRRGRVVWARQTPSDATSLHPRIAHDGTAMLIDNATFWGGGFDFGAGSTVRRMTIDGTVEQTWTTPGLHHPFTDTADGSLVWAANAGTNETIEVLTADGERSTLFDCKGWLHSVGLTGECGSNTLYWNEPTGTFLYSIYSLSTILEITAEGEVTRTFGQLEPAWDFQPAESALWFQHGGYYTSAGTLLVSTYGEEGGGETVVREYTLDDDTQTLTEVWSFGVGDGVWGQYMGEPLRLPGGNTLHNTGSEARLREATPAGEVVWDVTWGEGSGSHWIGRSTPVVDLYELAR